MRSGEWKGWLEAALGKVRNIGLSADTARASGTETCGASWTEIFTYQTAGKETKASLSIALGNFAAITEGVWCFPFNGDMIDYTGNLTAEAIGLRVRFIDDSPFGPGYQCLETNYDYQVYGSYVAKKNGEEYGVVNIGDGDFTIQVFFKLDIAIYSVNNWLFETNPGGGGLYFSYRGFSTYGELDIFNKMYTLNQPLTQEEWHWLVVQRESGEVTAYLDGDQVGDSFIETYEIFNWSTGRCGYGGGPGNYVRIADHIGYDYAKYTGPVIQVPSSPSCGSDGTPVNLRVLVNGNVVETVDYPSYARQFFSLSGLKQGDIISAEIKYGDGVDVDWWYTYEASTEGDESGGKLKYPAPEYLNDDPRWIGRWTDIYRLLLAAEGNTPGVGKAVESDEDSTDSYSYVATNTDTLCTVTVTTERATARVECFSRSLFTAFELHKDGSKIADLSMCHQRGDDMGFSSSTLCHDIVIVDVAPGSHTFTLKGVASTTESGHMEAQLHVIY